MIYYNHKCSIDVFLKLEDTFLLAQFFYNFHFFYGAL